MNKYWALLAAVLLLASSGVATAKTRHSRTYHNADLAMTTGQGAALSTPLRGASTTNLQAASGGRRGRAQHLVPENGGAPNAVLPGR